MESINLIELSLIKSEYCFTVNADGSRSPQFGRVLIRVENEDGSLKYYNIQRCHMDKYHSIETYTLQPNRYCYSEDRDNKRYKIYKKEDFDKRLNKISKQLAGLKFKIN